eukprot:Transcript_16462.p1 GENE.Transcript_16462~~Transcript_16462.p1  ORF type:complete len:518 (-),score=141.70 Transcript_16462:119-1627(-)
MLLLALAQPLGLPSPATRPLSPQGEVAVASPAPVAPVAAVPVPGAATCYANANLGSNQCGEIAKATCTGKGLGEATGECCSKGGYCGSDSTYCGDDMQVEFSHGNNVCPDQADVATARDAPAAAAAAAAPGEPKPCYKDANLGSNQCGALVGATCTGNGLGTATGKCCSATGYCGNDDTYCNDEMQVEYSNGNNVCPPEENSIAATGNTKPTECLKDAAKGSSQCGAAVGATCTGRHGLGKCCSSTGWCGDDPEFCDSGMQEEYSNAKNLCADELPEGAETMDEAEENCMTLDQVAVAWVSAVAPLDKTDAKELCVPAMLVAAGNTFNTNLCDGKFDPTVEADGYQTTLRGLWQIADEVFDSDPKKQAAVAYDKYTGNDITYGCNAEWCSMVQQGCNMPIPAIGQDDRCQNEPEDEESTCHRFCKGVWAGAAPAIPAKLIDLGGMEVVEAACKAAGKGVDAWANVKYGQMERHLETLVKKKPTKTKCDPIKSVCTYDDDDEQ